ncbi:hypothetical protein FOG18_11020 [Legionella israelensis]|uniref:hypothetical protein n=1 Tax=Legionella israelensis TaxID=454 RepID=UPI00117E85E1|nr:hypothetical protein [Legionella israelensis]QDP73057.1 hypothetical protein FOG18_11020 [Legionella israelensis]
MPSSTEKILGHIQPLNIETSRTVNYSKMKMSPIGRICFRGDDRKPKTIFNTGFEKREVISERLFDKIKQIYKEHIQTQPFEPKKFIKAVEDIRELVASDASFDLVQEFSNLNEFVYESWLAKILFSHKKNRLVVASDDEIKDIKKGIYSPFESHQLVSVSKRFKTAALFPIPSEVDEDFTRDNTYIYAVYLREGYDVHMQGVVSSLLNASTSKEEVVKAFKKANSHLSAKKLEHHIQNILHVEKISNMGIKEAMLMYIEEIVTKNISSEDIIAAVPIRRQFQLTNEGFLSGTFQLENDVQMNIDCELDKKTIKQVESFLKKEIKLNHKAKLPEPEEGYYEGFRLEMA